MCAFTDKLSQSRERELRRALFSLKQMFQVDKLTFRCLSAGKCRKQFDVFVIFLFHYFVFSQFSSHCNSVTLSFCFLCQNIHMWITSLKLSLPASVWAVGWLLWQLSVSYGKIPSTATILWPLCRTNSFSWQPQLTGAFCWSKLLLPACPCWWQDWQLAHSD